MMELVSSSTQKWTMVLARDLAADGRFVYAVKSTGIFCRPSCPSRRPRRDQVEFFKSPAEAQQAGYRPCRRCKPQQGNAQTEKVNAACRYIEANLDNTLHLNELARQVALSPFHFQRLFKRTLGISPREYQQARRAERFRNGLRSAARVTDAIYDAGYSSTSRAYETSATRLGMTPSAFRRGGEGTEIGFTVTDTDLGKLLIAATAKGICSVRFGESEAELLRDLQSEFTAATLKRSDQKLQQLSSDVCGLLSGAFISRDIPLDIRGTAFQQQVWNALRSIPPGETRSYATIAQDIGKPKAVRAVANACAANPVAIVVPCHRVVQKNGSLAGYRWGVERKAALLKNEQRHRLVPSRT
jgi:AraC family transcriptional regulator of adaptative response/methylated-DNA-[protein]-cysteine methyltransferase